MHSQALNVGGVEFATKVFAIGANEHCCGCLRFAAIIPPSGNPSPGIHVGAYPTSATVPGDRYRRNR
jgi:hypothetical protein